MKAYVIETHNEIQILKWLSSSILLINDLLISILIKNYANFECFNYS
jgi:hypothetical protein